MKLNQIEAWTLRVIERAAHNQLIEDARVELKAEWPNDAGKAARQIAGHANAARGEPILWLIGVDEKRGVVGADNEEIADWLAKVKSYFDGVAPHVTNLSVPSEGKTVVALLFETDRGPFVVRNSAFGQQNGGPVQWEVPWRENNSIRTATRADLIKLLVSIQKAPRFEVIDGSLSVVPTSKKDNLVLRWHLYLKLYVIPTSKVQLVIPFHHCEALLTSADHSRHISFDRFILEPLSRTMIIPGESLGTSSEVDSLTIQGTSTEVLIRGPGMIELRAEAQTPSEQYFEHDISAILYLHPVDIEHPITINAAMQLTPPEKLENGELAEWIFNRQVS